MGGRGSLPWKYKQRYLFTKYVHKQGNCIPESLRHRDLDSLIKTDKKKITVDDITEHINDRNI